MSWEEATPASRIGHCQSQSQSQSQCQVSVMANTWTTAAAAGRKQLVLDQCRHHNGSIALQLWHKWQLASGWWLVWLGPHTRSRTLHLSPVEQFQPATASLILPPYASTETVRHIYGFACAHKQHYLTPSPQSPLLLICWPVIN